MKKLMLVLALFVASALPALAGEECLWRDTLRDLSVSDVRMAYGDDGLWVRFVGIHLPGLPGDPATVVNALVEYEDFNIKVRDDLGGNALEVRRYNCSVTDNYVGIYANGGDVTFFVTSNAEKESWKRWLHGAVSTELNRRKAEKNRRYQHIPQPTPPEPSSPAPAKTSGSSTDSDKIIFAPNLDVSLCFPILVTGASAEFLGDGTGAWFTFMGLGGHLFQTADGRTLLVRVMFNVYENTEGESGYGFQFSPVAFRISHKLGLYLAPAYTRLQWIYGPRPPKNLIGLQLTISAAR